MTLMTKTRNSSRTLWLPMQSAMKADKERKEANSKKNRRDSDISDDWSSDEEDRKNAAADAEAANMAGKKRKRSKKD